MMDDRKTHPRRTPWSIWHHSLAYGRAGMVMRVLESGIDYLDVLLRILGKGRDAMQNWLSEGRVVKYFVVHGEVEVSSKMRAFVEVDK